MRRSAPTSLGARDFAFILPPNARELLPGPGGANVTLCFLGRRPFSALDLHKAAYTPVRRSTGLSEFSRVSLPKLPGNGGGRGAKSKTEWAGFLRQVRRGAAGLDCSLSRLRCASGADDSASSKQARLPCPGNRDGDPRGGGVCRLYAALSVGL